MDMTYDVRRAAAIARDYATPRCFNNMKLCGFTTEQANGYAAQAEVNYVSSAGVCHVTMMGILYAEVRKTNVKIYHHM